MKKKNNNYKKKRINIRLTEEERQLFEEKANNYPSMSALIIDAVKNFDNRGGANKIESLNKWGEDFLSFKTDINRVGNNINQIAHYLNVLKLQNIKLNSTTLKLINEQIDVWNKMFAEMVQLQTKYTKNVIEV